MAADGTVKILIQADGKDAIGSVDELKSSLGGLGSEGKKTGGLFKSIFSANLVSSAVISGLNALRGMLGGLGDDLSESSATWQTFQDNMSNLKMPQKEIDSTKASLQDFAQQTIYSASDMASTYSQLAAVGTKNTLQLVKGFGGLAAASAEPGQAMKTLSQQATQMAAKPKVAWEDFKLILEQTPAGVAAVAKTMGMSTTDMIKNVQDGKIATQDFFDAIAKTGTNANFSKMATQYKTVGQAMDGLRETLVNKLQPAYDKVSEIGIKGISKFSDAIQNINVDKAVKAIDVIYTSLRIFLQFITGNVDPFDEFHKHLINLVGKDTASKILPVLGKIGGAIYDFVSVIKGTFGVLTGSVSSYEEFGNAISTGISESTLSVLWGVSKAIKAIVDAAVAHPDAVVMIGKALLGLIAANKVVGILGGISGKFSLLGKAVSGIGSVLGGSVSKISGYAGKLLGFGKSTEETGNKSKSSAKQLNALGSAASKIGLGIGVAAAGIALLVYAIAELAKTGNAGQTVLMGVSVGIAAISFAITSGIKSLSAVGKSANGTVKIFNSLGMAALKIGVGIGVATLGIAAMVMAITQLASAGTSGLVALLGVTVAVAALVAVFALAGPVLTASAVGIGVFGAAVLGIGLGIGIASAGIALLITALTGLSANLTMIIPILTSVGVGFAMMITGFVTTLATNAPIIAQGILSMITSMLLVLTTAIPQFVNAGLQILVGVITGIANNIGQIITAGTNLIVNFLTGITAAIPRIVPAAVTALVTFINAVASNLGKIISAGTNLIVSFLNGLTKAIPRIVPAAVNTIVTFIGAIGNNLGKIINAGIDLIQKFIMGLIRAIPKIANNAKQAVMEFVEGVGYVLGKVLSSGSELINRFISGILKGISGSSKAGKSNGNAVLQGVSGIDLFGAGSKIIGGFLNGLQSKFEAVKSFVGGIAGWIKDHKGPISYDKRLLIPAGHAIMGGLNSSLLDGFKSVQATVSGMGDRLSLAMTPQLAFPGAETLVGGTLNVPASSSNAVYNTYNTTNNAASSQNSETLELLRKIANKQIAVDGSSFASAYEQYGSTETARRNQLKGRGLAIGNKF